MAEDKRELILARLLTIYKQLNANSFRNRLDISESNLPCIILNDADEMKEEQSDGRNRPSTGPSIVSMSPQTLIMVQESSPDIGSVLNSWRTRIIKAVMTDPTLILLAKEIKYMGFTNGLALGRAAQGQAHLSFTFVYVLRIDQL